MIDQEIDYKSTQELICPHCEKEQVTCDDDEDTGIYSLVYHCTDCDKKFYYLVHIIKIRTFTSLKK